MRRPIHRITFTHMLFPQALYRGASGQSSAFLPFQGICVHPSGKPISLSVSTGRSRLTVALQPGFSSFMTPEWCPEPEPIFWVWASSLSTGHP